MTRVSFAPARAPRVSAVLVTHGQWRWARRALEALAARTPEPYEVVVVDNASPDGTAEALEQETEGARVLLSERNAGFGAGCNRGAGAARGEVVVFLNSDAEVQDGWLPPLLDALADPSVAAAAPMVMSLDGSLQEAGALVSPAFGAAPYGDGDSPERPEYRFPRFVDYASAACLAVRRRAFHEVGGFDAIYGLGYFEDVDLCLALAERGYRIAYVPSSRVAHARWASYGEGRARELVERNRVLFSARWRGRLGLRPPSLGQEGVRQRIAVRDAGAGIRILVVAASVPAAPDPLHAVVATLRARWPTAAVALLADETNDVAASVLLARGVEVAEAADAARWLHERRFHYDVLVVCDAAAGPLVAAATDTQPQAYVIAAAADGEGLPADARIPLRSSENELVRLLDEALADAGAPPAHEPARRFRVSPAT